MQYPADFASREPVQVETDSYQSSVCGRIHILYEVFDIPSPETPTLVKTVYRTKLNGDRHVVVIELAHCNAPAVALTAIARSKDDRSLQNTPGVTKAWERTRFIALDENEVLSD